MQKTKSTKYIAPIEPSNQFVMKNSQPNKMLSGNERIIETVTQIPITLTNSEFEGRKTGNTNNIRLKIIKTCLRLTVFFIFFYAPVFVVPATTASDGVGGRLVRAPALYNSFKVPVTQLSC